MEIIGTKKRKDETGNPLRESVIGKNNNGGVTGSDTEHGGNLYRIAEETGIPEDKLIDFSASINPLGISKRVKDTIYKELDNLVHYPDPEATLLKNKLSGHHGIDPETILCGNGSTELIYLIPRALKPGKVLVTAPAFSEYEKACRLGHGSEVTTCALREENRFTINIEEFISAMKGCNMAFLCNPNNPTGTLLSRLDVLHIAEAARDAGCMLVVDEAFIDFIPDESVIRDVQDNPYLIVLRSMTKFYALTGLRIGYGVVHKNTAAGIKTFREPWSVNTLAQRAAVSAIEDPGYAAETMRLMTDEKEHMEKHFKSLGINFFPSAANYYLFKMGNAGSVINQLKKKGIIVRACSNFRGLNDSYIRAAVKSRRENTQFIEELSKICAA